MKEKTFEQILYNVFEDISYNNLTRILSNILEIGRLTGQNEKVSEILGALTYNQAIRPV